MTAIETGTLQIDKSLPQGWAAPTWRPKRVSSALQRQAAHSGRLWARRHRITLNLVDLVFITAATGLAAASFPHPAAGYAGVAVAVLWFLGLTSYRSRDLGVLGIGWDEYKRVITASLITFALFSMLCEVLALGVEHSFLVLAYGAGLGGVLCGRVVLRGWLVMQRAEGRCLSRVVILGEACDVEHAIRQLRKKSAKAYAVIGVALVGEQAHSNLIVDGQQVPVVSDVGSLVPALKGLSPDAVIVAGPVPEGSNFIRDLSWRLEECGAQLILATGLTSVSAMRMYACPIEGLPLIHVQLPRYSGAKHAVKRLLDILLSGGALIALLPVFATLALLITRDSSGPAIFHQERVGRGGQPFTMYKFRSMVQTAEADLASLRDHNQGAGVLFKMREDPRVTTIGKWLRRHSLDELPQLWNVLKGDMSLVGPRPPLPAEVATYQKDVHRRLYVRPGLTGLWQVNGRSDLSWKESVRLDLYYVENWSLTGDLAIMLQTAGVVLKPHGAY